MGAYSPAPIVTPQLHQRIMREVIEPTLQRLAQRRQSVHRAFCTPDLMIAADGTPNVLEFNCRFGDPETQPILMRLQSDLVDLCEAALDGTLSRVEVRWDPRAALGVVMAAGGYPDQFRTGDPISGLENAAGLPGKVFHAGTRAQGRPDRHGRRPRAVRGRLGRQRRRGAAPGYTIWCTRFTGIWCSTASISAIGPSSAKAPRPFRTGTPPASFPGHGNSPNGEPRSAVRIQALLGRRGRQTTPSKSAVVSIYCAAKQFVDWTTRTISSVFFKDLQQ